MAQYEEFLGVDLVEDSVFLDTDDKKMEAFYAHPKSDDPNETFPVVIFLMDAPGYRGELVNMSRRIARHGYCAILPDLYHKFGEEGRFRWTKPREGPEYEAHLKKVFACWFSLDNDGVAADGKRCLAFLDANVPQADKGAVGCIGFCMSGAFAVGSIARIERMRIAVGCYATHRNLDTTLADKINGEVYLCQAEHDDYCTAEQARDAISALQRANVRASLDFWPSVHHGFMFPMRPGIFKKKTADMAWEKIFGKFSDHLKSPRSMI